MANASDYLEVELRKHIFRTGSFTKPTVLAVGLFTVTPSDAGGGAFFGGFAAAGAGGHSANRWIRLFRCAGGHDCVLD